MPATYEPITTTTLTGTTNAVTFSSLGLYTDIVMVINQKAGASGGYELQFRINGDTGTNYSWARILATPTNATDAAMANSQTQGRIGDVDTEWQTTIANFMNYRGSTQKAVLAQTQSVNTPNNVTRTGCYVSTFHSTSAVTSITIKVESTGTFATGSTFTLYGIKAA